MRDELEEEKLNNAKPEKKAGYSIKSVVAYALALAAALGINELSESIFKYLNLSTQNEIITKVLYVLFMFGLIVLFIYTTNSTVSI